MYSPETFDFICSTIPRGKTKSQELDEESVELILEIHKKQRLGARRLEKIIEFEHGIHSLDQIRTRTEFDGSASRLA